MIQGSLWWCVGELGIILFTECPNKKTLSKCQRADRNGHSSATVVDQGGGGANRPRPPPLFRLKKRNFHPGGRSGRRTVPLPHNVNDAKRVPPPPSPHWTTFSCLARHRGIWIPGPPFSQILDPPLARFKSNSLPIHVMTRDWYNLCWSCNVDKSPAFHGHALVMITLRRMVKGTCGNDAK